MEWWNGPDECRVLILGLDYAGKSTLISRMKFGKKVDTTPTIGFNLQTIKHKSIVFQCWDMGGQTSLRPMWRCYFADTDAIVWVLDSVDRDRFETSKKEFYSLLSEEELKYVTFFFFFFVVF